MLYFRSSFTFQRVDQVYTHRERKKKITKLNITPYDESGKDCVDQIFNSHVALRSLDVAGKEFRGSLWSLCYFCRRNKRLAFYSIVKNL